MKKILTIVLCVCFIIVAIPLNTIAASYDACDHPFVGWGTSISKAYDKPIGIKKGVGGLDNRQSTIKGTYSADLSFTHSIAITAALAGELNGDINIETGEAKGKLGAKINSSFSIQSAYTHQFAEHYSAVVPAKKNLTVYSQAYGVNLTIYAIWHTCWIQVTKVNGTIGIPQYQKFVPVISSVNNTGWR